MKRVEQDALGQCDFIDVLEEAALRGKQVAVELRDGTAFLDRLVDVVTAEGADLAVFESRGRVAVADIRSVSRQA